MHKKPLVPTQNGELCLIALVSFSSEVVPSLPFV